MLAEHIKQFTSWILPHICICCGFDSETEFDICIFCKNNLPWISNRCYSCGLALVANFEAMICEPCRSNAPPFNRLCGMFAYEPPITTFITQLKFSKKIAMSALLSHLMAEAVKDHWYKGQQLPELIIPVPLHQLRHRHRGYNQALELCQPLAKLLSIPLGADVCQRVKFTKQQSRLNKSQRNANLRNAFTVKGKIQYKHVAIVDDVVTTGSTVRAMCLALLTSGVETIDVWCVARA
jgi:ComF family protein